MHAHTQKPYSTVLTTSLVTKSPSAFPLLPILTAILNTRIKDVPLWTRETYRKVTAPLLVH